jgi:protocatechuate 3,4-dioxygenase beta subunit
MDEHSMDRRRALLGFGGLVVGVFAGGAGCSSSKESTGATAPTNASTAGAGSTVSCVLTSALTEGPYFVDERLNRSDIRTDPSDGSVSPGTPLRLRLTVYRVASGGCVPHQGALVDVWHADAGGTYSDVGATTGRKYLRGNQVSDSDGVVEFLTIYPGWYTGRAVHIHFKARTFDGSATTYEFTSQLFFDERVTSQVYAESPYRPRGPADTGNASDSIFDRTTILKLSRNGSEYLGTLAVGLSGLPDAGAR